MNSYVLAPIPSSEADVLRAGGGPLYVVDAKPGYPCRLCLRDAEVGDVVVLVSYDPFTLTSPYRSSSPIFLHQQRCGPPESLDDLPEQLTSRTLSVRSFDSAEMMIGAAVVEGAHLDAAIQDLFNDDRALRLHVHNASPGCWATSIVRAADSSEHDSSQQ